MVNKLKLATAMMLYGTIACIVSFMTFPSGMISLCRGIIGAGVVAMICVVNKISAPWEVIRKNLKYMVIAGILAAVSWISVLEAYRATTIAVATLCYYTAPTYVMLLSPVFLKEKMTWKKLICVAVVLLGMVFVSGVVGDGGGATVKGMLLGLLAAVSYAAVMIIVKFIDGIPPLLNTAIQLTATSLTVIPYALLTVDFSALEFSARNIILVVILGVFHTGLTSHFFFTSVQKLPGQTAAIYTYIDPILALLLSVVVVRQVITPWQILGSILVLGAAVVSEVMSSREKDLAAKTENA